MVLVVAHRRQQEVGGNQCWLDGFEPTLEVVGDQADESLSMFPQSIAEEAELLRLLFFAVHCADECAAFYCEHGLDLFGIAELAAPIGVAAGFEHAAIRIDPVEPMLRVGGERTA